jgi:pyruvate dehydrogenase E2 component (dihydrolipoyllysine-residue acetyltransferase)
MNLIRLPRLGQTMESGMLTAWHVTEGQQFAEGTLLYEVETDKMTTEVEAKQAGVLLRIVAALEEQLDVGAVIGVTGDVGETASSQDIDAFLGRGADTAEAAPDGDATELPAGGPATADILDEPHPDAAATPVDGHRSSGVAGRPLAVPKARKVAREAGIDLGTVQGTGKRGVIRVSDVQHAVRAAAVVASAPAATPAAAPAAIQVASSPEVRRPEVAVRIPVRGVARSMADAVSRSWREIPQFVQQVTLDATALAARLKRLRYEGVSVTYTDLLIAAVSWTAVEVAEVNATFTAEEIIRYSDVNVSFAVATDRGLVVPVVRQAHALDVAAIAARTRELAGRAREGRLTAADTTDGTITVSNLGAFGVETGTPIVNAPQSAIVFVGAMGDRAVVVDGQLAVRTMLNIAVAYDHRVVDGMTGARFTSALKARLEAGG